MIFLGCAECRFDTHPKISEVEKSHHITHLGRKCLDTSLVFSLFDEMSTVSLLIILFLVFFFFIKQFLIDVNVLLVT